MSEEIEAPEEKAPKPTCLNCEKQMPRKAKFCPNCGQPNNKGRVTMRDMLEKVWHNFTHTDGKFVKMCAHLLLPSRVTMEYFRGRQKRYPHPFQFFFVAMFFFILTVNHFWNRKFHEKPKESTGFHFNLTFDEDSLGRATKNLPSDSIRTKKKDEVSISKTLDLMKQHAQNLRWQRAYNDLPDKLKTPDARRLADTLFKVQFDKTKDFINVSDEDKTETASIFDSKMDSVPISFGTESVKIAVEDFAFTPTDEIIEKYQIKVWWRQILLKQSLKTIRDFEGLKRSFIGSFTWTIILQTALLSLFLMLLYRSQRRWYVEHFLFLLNFHTGVLIALCLTILAKFFSGSDWVWLPFLVWAGVHLYLSMRNFYYAGQGSLVFKYLIFNVLYWFFFVLLFVLGTILVFVIF